MAREVCLRREHERPQSLKSIEAPDRLCSHGLVEDRWLQAALEEYKSLRQESLEAISQQQTTLQIGLVAIGALTALTAKDVVDRGAPAQLAVAVSAPALALAVQVLWLQVVKRSVKAGAHLARLEVRVDARIEATDPPLTWESNVVCGHKRRGGYAFHWSVMVVMTLASIPTAAFGLVALARAEEWALFAVGAATVLLLIAAAVLFHKWFHGKLSQMQEDAAEDVRRGLTWPTRRP
jgi:hypothetical protein